MTMTMPESDTRLRVGDAMPDGSIYAGVSPDTWRAMYTTPKDTLLACTFRDAAEFAFRLYRHDHYDWRMPSRAELNVLFQNRAAIGGFDTTGSHPGSWYWSSARKIVGNAWVQRFGDGVQCYYGRKYPSALRCVRG
jgi:hypothetical protein